MTWSEGERGFVNCILDYRLGCIKVKDNDQVMDCTTYYNYISRGGDRDTKPREQISRIPKKDTVSNSNSKYLLRSDGESY